MATLIDKKSKKRIVYLEELSWNYDDYDAKNITIGN